MSLHITSDEAGGLRTVHVAGALGSVGLGELRSACREAPRLRLDLSELLTADEAGTNLLAALRDEGAELVSVPPYVDLLLRTRHGRAPQAGSRRPRRRLADERRTRRRSP